MSAEVAETKITITVDGASLGEVIDFNRTGIVAELIPTSHYDTPIPTAANEGGSETFIASQHVNPGGFSLQVHLNPDKVVKIGGNPVPWVVQFAPTGGDTVGARWEFDAFFTSEDNAFPFKGKMVRTLNGQLSGSYRTTPGSAT